MLNFILILFAITNMYSTMFMNNENPVQVMKEFIENQQYREDQLRYQCENGNFIIKPKPTIYEEVYTDLKKYLSNSLPRFTFLALNGSPIHIKSYNEFLDNSKQESNIGRTLIYKNNKFILKSVNPSSWKLTIGELTLDISGVKFDNSIK